MSQSTNFQSCQDNFLSSFVEPVLSSRKISCSRAQHSDSCQSHTSNATLLKYMFGHTCICNYVMKIISIQGESPIIHDHSAIYVYISSLSGSALKTHVETLDKPGNVNKLSQSLAW